MEHFGSAAKFVKDNVPLISAAAGTGAVLTILSKESFALVGKIVDEVFKDNSFYAANRSTLVWICMFLAVIVILFVLISTWKQMFNRVREREIRLEAELGTERRVNQQLQDRIKELQDEKNAEVKTKIRETTEMMRKMAETEASLQEIQEKYEEEVRERRERMYNDLMNHCMRNPLHNK